MDSQHSARCRACKERVAELLAASYGDCRANHRFPWSARPEDYADSAIGIFLGQIRSALGDLRGHRDFIKSAQMPPCDYFIADPPFIVEFDENQHFSLARFVTLNNYPANARIGFPISRWRELCREIDAKDDEPLDRDERRAWYDVLRDLLPSLHGFRPTVRLYSEEFPWCTLDPASAHGVENFRKLLGDRLPARAR